jgi:hypothetical protein
MIKLKTYLIVFFMMIVVDYMGPAVAGDKVGHVKPEREVLTQAEEVGFDYLGKLRRAQRGEIEAAVALIDFSTQTDAAAALAHGWVLLDLQKILGRRKFATCLGHASNAGRRSALRIMKVARTYE